MIGSCNPFNLLNPTTEEKPDRSSLSPKHPLSATNEKAFSAEVKPHSKVATNWGEFTKETMLEEKLKPIQFEEIAPVPLIKVDLKFTQHCQQKILQKQPPKLAVRMKLLLWMIWQKICL